MSDSINNEENPNPNDLSISQRLNKISRYKRRRSKKINYKEHFVEYTQNTSLHGFKYLGQNDNTIIDKIWWFVMIFISILTSAYLINIVWEKWQHTPVIVTFAENSRDISTIPFPAITLCPDIKVRQSVYNFTSRYNDFINENYSYTDQELSEFNSMAVLCHNYKILSYHIFNKSADESMIGDIMRVSPRLHQTLRHCKINIWDNASSLFCKSHFNEILTDDGLCFTYNMLDSKELYNENTLQYNYNSTSNKKNEDWDYDTGYAGINIDTYPQRGIGPGLQSAISLAISRNSTDHDEMCTRFGLSGIKVTIHPPNVIPRILQHFFWIPINKDTTLAVTPRHMTTSEQLLKYTPERRGCYFSHEKKLKFFKNYTKENCQLECLTNYTMAVCNCATYYMPRVKEMPICSMSKSGCQRIASESINLDQHNYDLTKSTFYRWGNFSEESRKIASECNCLASCTSISYSAVISETQLTIPKNMKIDGLDFSSIRVFFKDSYFIPTKRSELYGISNFLGNCGGLLGLCLGFSMLSLIEIVYYLTIRLYIKFRRTFNEQP